MRKMEMEGLSSALQFLFEDGGFGQYPFPQVHLKLVVTGAMNGESANKFISALVKALQTLCHGYVEFNDGIEIIGHIYLNIDSGASFDYVVKEKLCKNAENSTVFVSKSFQAHAPIDDCLARKGKDEDQAVEFEDAPDMSPTAGTSRIQSAITSISNVLSGTQHSHKSRLLDHSSHQSSPQNTGKRKREHNGNYSNIQPPFKYMTLQASSSSSSSSYFSSGPSSKLAADRNHSEHFSNPSHAEFFGGDSNQSSGMGADDDDDLHLDVTFVKEEFESQRNSSQRGVSASAASRLSQDPSSSHSNILHDGTSGGGVLGYSSSHHQGSQQFAGGTAGDLGNINDSFQDSSQVDVGQHTGQGLPNPRSDLSGVQDLKVDSPSSQSLKLDDMTGISDTLQLGIKLFGPKFVADVASGDISLSSASVDLVSANGTDIHKSASASVFPEMFDLTTVCASSIKPDHKVLWHDRKDKMRKTYLMRKAHFPKLCNKESGNKAADDDHGPKQSASCKTIKRLQSEDGLLDQFGVPYRRKRGRPPKRLKLLSGIEDILMGKHITETKKELNQNALVKENFTERASVSMQLLSQCVDPIRSIFGNEYFSRRIRGSYRQYTAADKLKIIEFGLKYGSTAASRKYNIPESTVRSWTKKMDTFLMQMNLSGASCESQVLNIHADKNDAPISIADQQHSSKIGANDIVDALKTESLPQDV